MSQEALAAPAFQSPHIKREILVGAALALVVSIQAILVLCFGMAGVSGNSVFTGGLFLASIGSVLLLGSRRGITPVLADFLFLGWVACAAVSAAVTERSADLKEAVLFVVSLAAYPAFRCISLERGDDIRSAFAWVTGAIVAAGTVATAYALFVQWELMPAHPLVFGFGAAATNFLTVCGFLIIAMTSSKLTARRTAILSASIFLPVAVFSASQVRLTFIAIVGSLFVSALVGARQQRKYIAAVVFVVLAGIVAGGAARSSTTKLMLGYAVEKTVSTTADEQTFLPPSCTMKINMLNTIAIREALLQDALYLIPRAGLFGLGLDRFTDVSCLKMEVHNSFLQASVEFGWVGGLCLALAAIASSLPLFRLSRSDDNARFALCSLIYIAMISSASGILSGDLLLFAMMGLAARASQCEA